MTQMQMQMTPENTYTQPAVDDELEEFREEFRSTLRSFLEKQIRGNLDPYSRVVQSDEIGTSWRQLAEQIGVAGVLVPEEYGGLGLMIADAGVIAGECARALYGGPVISTAILAPLLLQWVGTDDAREQLLPSIASGSSIVAVAIDDMPDRSTMAVQVQDGWRLTGSKSPVLDGSLAETLMVVVKNGDETFRLFEVSAADQSVSLTDFEGLDHTRRLTAITFDSTPATLIGEGTADHLTLLSDVAAIMAATEAAAASEECLSIAVDYAKVREQFGQRIGSFQAVKHMCAELYVLVESQRATILNCVEEVGSVVRQASIRSVTIPDLIPPASEAASVAKAYICSSATNVAETTIQILGGIGFTWEHNAHRYLRRVKSLENLFGSPLEHRRRIARLMDEKL